MTSKKFNSATSLMGLIAVTIGVAASLPASANGGRSHGGHSGNSGHYAGVRGATHSAANHSARPGGVPYSPALRGHGHGPGYVTGRPRVNVVVAPAYRYYPRPYYYAPPVYYSPGYYAPSYYQDSYPAQSYGPTTYIEQAPEQAAPANYWYYCASAQAYYPHVQQCAESWQRVVPHPPPPAPG